VALKADCDVDVSGDALAFAPVGRRDEAALRSLYEELGFTRQLASLNDGSATILSQSPREPLEGGSSRSPTHKVEATERPLHIITDESSLTQLISQLAEGRWALEILTLRPDHHRGPIIAAAISSAAADYFLPFQHRYVGAPEQLAGGATLSKILRALEKGKAIFALHDVKRTLVMLGESDLAYQLTSAHDTMLGSYLLDPERSHDIPHLAASVGLTVPDYDAFSK